MVALADTDACQLATVEAARALLLLVPIEHAGALVERLFDESGRERTAVLADLAVGFGRIELADRDPVDAELARRFVEHRLKRRNELVLAGTALRSRRRRVGEHGHRAVAHGLGLIEHRKTIAGGPEIAGALVRAGLLHDIEIGGDQPAVGAKAE